MKNLGKQRSARRVVRRFFQARADAEREFTPQRGSSVAGGKLPSRAFGASQLARVLCIRALGTIDQIIYIWAFGPVN